MTPLTPEGCDLRGLEWMPLYGGRLFGSDFDAHATDSEWRTAMQLWWAAWNQVPAASLPDDDVALCRLAGYGRDARGWSKVRDRALHGFVKCSDGRLYHKALAIFAHESWDRRLKDRKRKAKYREEKERREAEEAARRATGTGRGQDADGDMPGTADEMRCDEMGQDETGQDATLKGVEGASAPKPKRKTMLPKDWQPTEEQLAYAAEHGSTNPPETAERFRLNHLSKGTMGVDWNLGFQYWCRNEKKFNGGGSSESYGDKRAREVQEAIERSKMQ